MHLENLYILVAIVVGLLFGISMIFKWCFMYWDRVGIPSLRPTIPFGNFKEIVLKKCNFGIQIEKLYNDLKAKGVKYGGTYFFIKPVFIVIDPELIKRILTTDFNYFTSRGMYYNEKIDPLSAHFFAIDGQKWKRLRAKFSPQFTPAKIKMMFQTVVDCSNLLPEAIDEYGTEPMDIKEISARYTIDVIGSTIFGVKCNSLKQGEDDEFRQLGRRYFKANIIDSIKTVFSFAWPQFLRYFNLSVINKTVAKSFVRMVNDIVTEREMKNIIRNDLMHLMLQLKNQGYLEGEKDSGLDSYKLTFNELAAQAFSFFLGGYETTSITLTFSLFELSRHKHMQDKLRDEINTVLAKHYGKFTYEAMADMQYMEQVLNEALRLYTPFPHVQRICTDDYTLPGTNIILKKGTTVFIPIYGLHHDAEHFPNPMDFDPERFSDEIKRTRHPCTFIPFGEGQRICLALKFGMLQMKIALSVLLKNFYFELNEQTKLPFKMDPNGITTSPLGIIWLNATKIST